MVENTVSCWSWGLAVKKHGYYSHLDSNLDCIDVCIC